MTVRFYQSTDASAPTIYGSVASGYNLCNLLNAILVTGYGSLSAAGWTMPYTGTNKAAFLQAGAGGQYLYVDDSAALYARVRGYETMSSISAGTGPYPTDAQISGGGYLHRSSTSDTTARPWFCIADSTFFCLAVNYDSTASTGCSVLMFGDITSYKSSDAYHKLILCGTTATATSYTSADMTALATAATGHFMPRAYTQLGSAITLGKHTDSIKTGLSYPHPVDGGLYLGKIWIHEPTLGVVRGELRGVWFPLCTPIRSLSHGDTFNGTGALSGKSFLFVNVYNAKALILETSNTW